MKPRLLYVVKLHLSIFNPKSDGRYLYWVYPSNTLGTQLSLTFGERCLLGDAEAGQ